MHTQRMKRKKKKKFEKHKIKKKNLRLTCTKVCSSDDAGLMLSNRQRCEWYSWRAGAAQEAVNGHDRSSRRWRRKGRWDRQWPDAPRSLGPSRRPSGRATCPPRITPPQSTMVWDRSGGERSACALSTAATRFRLRRRRHRHVKCYYHHRTPPVHDDRRHRTRATFGRTRRLYNRQCTASAPRLPPKTKTKRTGDA